jgi:hypothetical protein
MQKWEYKKTDSLEEDDLNVLGEQGWELVAIENYEGEAWYMYFKRPKS